MPKKKPAAKRSKLAAYRSARQPIAKRNPGGIEKAAMGFAVMVGPGIGGYAASRLTGRVAKATLGKKIAGGRFEKHFGPLGNLAVLLGIYFAAKKWDKLRRHQEPAMIGSAIALLQSIIQTYLPGMAGWIDAQPALPSSTPRPTAAGDFQRGRKRRRGTGIRYVSIGELETEDNAQAEREDRGEADEVRSQSQEAADELPPDDADSPLSDESPELQDLARENEDIRELYSGAFSN